MVSLPDLNRQYPSDLLDRARQGDQEAWEMLFNECYPKVVRVIRRRLNRRMRRIYDSADIANEVMKSLAAKFDHFDFSSIDGLRAFLVKAAEQKTVDYQRHGHALKRDLGRDQYFLAVEAGAWEPADSAPTASQVAVASEEEGMLLNAQSEEQRTILKLKIEGYSNSEVSQSTGWHLRKVERFLQNLRGTWRF